MKRFTHWSRSLSLSFLRGHCRKTFHYWSRNKDLLTFYKMCLTITSPRAKMDIDRGIDMKNHTYTIYNPRHQINIYASSIFWWWNRGVDYCRDGAQENVLLIKVQKPAIRIIFNNWLNSSLIVWINSSLCGKKWRYSRLHFHSSIILQG